MKLAAISAFGGVLRARVKVLLFACLPAMTAHAETVEFRNGRWFNGRGFQERTAYAVEGILSFQRPSLVDRSVDLGGRYVVPPYAEAHTHSLSSSVTQEKHIQEYLRSGVFYVLVQDAATEVTRELLANVNKPDSVDVSYTQGVVTPSWGMIADFYRSMAEQGHFGNRKSLSELDTWVIFLIDSRADLDRKFDQLAAVNRDFVKVLLGFSEEIDKRRNNSAYKNVPGGSSKAGLDPKLLPELVRRARARNLRVSVHVETATDFRIAVKAGVDMIAHLPGWQVGPSTGFTDGSLSHWKITAADARLAAEKKVTVITTATHDPKGENYQKFTEINRHNLGLLRAAGVRVALGSDGFERANVADPEALYVAEVGGFDNLAILKMLTETTARTVFPARKIGELSEGYEANFLALDADPLAELQNLKKIDLRVKAGRELEVPQPVTITTSHIGGGVHLLDGAVDLIGVSAGDDGLLLVDGGYMETLPAVHEALDKFGKGKPKILINTHWHHGFANEGFGKETVLVAHRAVRELLRRENFMFNRTIPAKPPVAWPVVTFEESLTIHFNSEDIQLVYLPNAHTDGDIG